MYLYHCDICISTLTMFDFQISSHHIFSYICSVLQANITGGRVHKNIEGKQGIFRLIPRFYQIQHILPIFAHFCPFFSPILPFYTGWGKYSKFLLPQKQWGYRHCLIDRECRLWAVLSLSPHIPHCSIISSWLHCPNIPSSPPPWKLIRCLSVLLMGAAFITPGTISSALWWVFTKSES